MSRPPGLSAVDCGDDVGDDNDAAMIDSFFLPGGILDPDEDEEEQQHNELQSNNQATHFGLGHSPGTMFSRVPSNPWSTEFFENIQEKKGEVISLEHQHSSVETADIQLGQVAQDRTALASPSTNVVPPPGYTGQTMSSKSSGVSTIERSHRLSNAWEKQSPGLVVVHDLSADRGRILQGNGSSQGKVDEVPPAFQNRTIERPKPKQNGTTWTTIESKRQPTIETKNPVIKFPVTEPVDEEDEGFIEISGDARQVANRISKKLAKAQKDRAANRFMAIIDAYSDDESEQGGCDDRQLAVGKNSRSTLEAATDIEGSAVGGLDDVEDEDDNMENSAQGEPPFPMESLTFINGIDKTIDSTTSSLSTSSDSTSEQDESDGEGHETSLQYPDQTDEITEALNSEVAVILDVGDSTKEGVVSPSQEDSKKGDTNPILKTLRKSSPIRSTNVRSCKAEKVSSLKNGRSSKKTAKNVDEADRSSAGSSLIETLGTLRTAIVSKASGCSKCLQDYIAVMDDYRAVVSVIASSIWRIVHQGLSVSNKAAAISVLFFIQVWKYAFVELIEEPQISVCYLIFYAMPHFCSLLLRFFLIPHWTPHFITCVAAWALCTQTNVGSLHLGRISILQIPNLVFQANGRISAEIRMRDERACRTILRILRFVLPIFFFVDGFSTEFGTIMGVSGSSRLTTAFMMSLVRKNLVSSPIVWVSWAVQVLLATQHPSSVLVDLLVFTTGLSSIRLIRYLEDRGAGSKKRVGKNH